MYFLSFKNIILIYTFHAGSYAYLFLDQQMNLNEIQYYFQLLSFIF